MDRRFLDGLALAASAAGDRDGEQVRAGISASIADALAEWRGKDRDERARMMRAAVDSLRLARATPLIEPERMRRGFRVPDDLRATLRRSYDDPFAGDGSEPEDSERGARLLALAAGEGADDPEVARARFFVAALDAMPSIPPAQRLRMLGALDRGAREGGHGSLLRAGRELEALRG